MKKAIKFLTIPTLVLLFQISYAQSSFYTTSGGEMLFQMSNVDQGGSIETNMRWTLFLHLGTYLHMDFNDNVGAFTGLALRNVGFITNEGTEKKIRRTYNLGIPLAIKVGLFDKQIYVFGGGEYEWLFHYKEKYWPNSNGKRDGEKVKYTEWFTNRTNRLMPSLFFGVALPKGFNVKFKYYMKNYMNQDYIDSNGDLIYSDLDVKLYYISLGWNMRMDGYIKKIKKEI
jgi:hypothetical protein